VTKGSSNEKTVKKKIRAVKKKWEQLRKPLNKLSHTQKKTRVNSPGQIKKDKTKENKWILEGERSVSRKGRKILCMQQNRLPEPKHRGEPKDYKTKSKKNSFFFGFHPINAQIRGCLCETFERKTQKREGGGKRLSKRGGSHGNGEGARRRSLHRCIRRGVQ